MSDAPSEKTADQLTLDLLCQSLGAEQAAQLPAGVGDLSGRELGFVQRLLQGQSRVEAALAMEGRMDRESATRWATRTLRKPQVMAFYGKCVERIAAQSGEIARRMTERTLALHKIAMDELQRWEDAQALVIEEMLEHEKCRRSGIQITANQQVILGMRERARDTAYSQAQAAVKAAQTSDDTLAAMLGKLQIRVEGEVQHIHVSTHALKYLSETRRDMLAAGGGN